jgi:hypothetical protein
MNIKYCFFNFVALATASVVQNLNQDTFDTFIESHDLSLVACTYANWIVSNSTADREIII